MALEFRPPEWLLQEYVNRRRPQDEIADQLDKISQQQMAQRQQQVSNQNAASKNLIDLIGNDPELLKTPLGQRVMKQSGVDLGGYQPPTVSSGTAQSPSVQPPTQTAGTAPDSGSPIISHWNSMQGGGQTEIPTAPDVLNQLGTLENRGKLGQKAISNYKTTLETAKLAKELGKPDKGPLKTVTKEQAISNGVFDPTKEIIVDPSQATTAETKQERLGSSFRKELTSSDPYKKLVASKTAAENIEKAVNDPGAYGDLGMLFDYMKALDPISVVREGEQEMFKKTGSFTQSMANTMNKIVNGQTVTPEQRKEVLKYAKNRLRTAHDQYKNHAEPTLRQSKRLGVDPLEVDPFYGQSFDAPEQTGQAKSFLKPGEEDAYAAYKASVLKGGNK